MEKTSLSREELYTLVWEKPISHIAQELGVKAADLPKHCVNLEIPLPEQGHWSRLKFGKEIVQTPLPPAAVHEITEAVTIEKRQFRNLIHLFFSQEKMNYHLMYRIV